MVKFKKNISYSKLINLFLFIFLFTSQFYTYDAGQFQYSHFFFLLFSFFILRYLLIKRTVELSLINYFIIINYFLFYVFFLNLFYSFLYSNFYFLKSSLYFFVGIFIAFIICCYLYYFNISNFFKKILIICNSSILFFYFFNLGEYQYPPRFNAFFYGPGQMAYWSICIFSSHLLLFDKIILKKEIVYIYLNLLMTVSIILISGTRSAFLCLPFLFFIFLYFISFFKINFFSKVFFLFFFIFFIFAALSQEISTNTIDRFLSADYLSHLEFRGYTRIIDYPQYLIFGSGQGLDERFYLTSDLINGQITYFSFEIHSSFVAILFYYGIIGFILFILFLYRIFKNLNFIQKTALFLPFIYGLSTYGLRTPIFWVFIGVCVFVSINNLKNKIS